MLFSLMQGENSPTVHLNLLMAGSKKKVMQS